MRKIIIATHAHFASGILSTLEMIMGEQKNILALCAYTEDNIDYKNEIQKEIDKLDDQDEIIIVTDLFGGSVNNTLMSLASNRIHIVAGINLPFLLQLCVSNDETPIEDVIQVSMNEAKQAFVYCNQLIKEYQKSEENKNDSIM